MKRRDFQDHPSVSLGEPDVVVCQRLASGKVYANKGLAK